MKSIQSAVRTASGRSRTNNPVQYLRPNLYTRIRISIIGFCGAAVLRLVNLTLRWEYVGLDGEERWWADKSPCIVALWHGRQLFLPWIYLRHRTSRRSPHFTALISQHRDGRMMAEGMRFLGIDSIPGSKSQGGLRALYALVRRLKNNSHIAITPDGPKGPARKIKNGVLLIAQRSGAKIYPSSFSAEKFWRFRSWDGMIFPKPFSRAVMVKGAPITIQSGATNQEMAVLSQSVEDALNEVTARGDSYFLRPSVHAA